MYVIHIKWDNSYLKKNSSCLFNNLANAHVFDTRMQARHTNKRFLISGSIKKVNSKEMFNARLGNK